MSDSIVSDNGGILVLTNYYYINLLADREVCSLNRQFSTKCGMKITFVLVSLDNLVSCLRCLPNTCMREIYGIYIKAVYWRALIKVYTN